MSNVDFTPCSVLLKKIPILCHIFVTAGTSNYLIKISVKSYFKAELAFPLTGFLMVHDRGSI